ncbi:hypothetical protein CH263_12540 [Rhodococcus sp. 06-1059B-a]|nr:hypothetical protein CH263_12540 [Rhodococcus sp. 06-1059B-a]
MLTTAGGRSWSMRGQNFLLEYIEAAAGDAFVRHAQGEHILLVLDDVDVDVALSVDDHRADVDTAAVVVLPSGTNTVQVNRPTRLVHLVDARDPNAVKNTMNAERYATPDARVAGITVTPRHHPRATPEIFRLSDYPPESGRFGTIFRSETLLVNILDTQIGPRDPDKLSPHHHDDFEQCSLAVEGQWVHHLRTPWVTQRSQWKDDEHHRIGSPSATIIPPPLVHTSEAVGDNVNRLIDIFCPVRQDFVDRGWVLNACNYSDVPR